MPKQLLESKVVSINAIFDSKLSNQIEKSINDVLALDDSPSWEYKNAFEAGKQIHMVFIRSKK